MIVLRKQQTGEVFDIPENFSLEINNTSPLFNDIGSKSVTTTLPKSPRNARMLGYAHRLDIAYRPTARMPVVIVAGSYTRSGMLYLSAAHNTTNGYGVTVAFDEGVMYEEMKNIRLDQLPNLPVDEHPAAEMIDYMNNLWKNDSTALPLTVVPVLLSRQSYKDESGVDSPEKFNPIYLNDHNAADTLISEQRRINMVIDGSLIEVDAPAGYGVSPFVRAWYVIERIFDHFGYTIGENPFKTHFQLKRLTLLNNVIDSIVLNRIDYAQLLPAVTISDFLQSLYGRFGAKVFVDGNTRTVNIRLLKDILSATDITPLNLNTPPDIDYTEPLQLKLTAQTNMDRAKPETDTFADFLRKYNNTVGAVFSNRPAQLKSGIVFSPREGLFYQVSTTGDAKIISSAHFNWDQQAKNMEYEEIASPDECLTMDNEKWVPYFGIKPDFRNSALVYGEDFSAQDTEENKLAYIWDMGNKYQWIDGQKRYYSGSWGSIFPNTLTPPPEGSYLDHHIDRAGNVFQYALTHYGSDGCFYRFFKEFDAFLRHSNNTVSAELSMPAYQLAALPMSGKYAVDNQPLLMDKIDQTLGRQQSAAVAARTLRLYQPYDLEADRYMPTPDDIRYQWVFKVDWFDVIEAKRAELEEFYRQQDAETPGITFVSLTFEGVLDPKTLDPMVPPLAPNLWLLHPTRQEYIEQTRLSEVGVEAHVDFVHTYTIYAEGQTTVRVPVYRILALSSYFHPASI